MRARYLSAVLVGLILGAGGTAIVVRQPPAHAQGKDARAAWEYRVVFATVDNEVASAEAMTKQFGRLAADGWEYVGPAAEATRAGPAGQYAGARGAFVVFRRPKS
jgi:hypothetical protein